MASKRQRNRALKRERHVNPDDLAPGIAKGLTQGASAQEALDEFPTQGVSGVEMIRHMSGERQLEGMRGVPRPHFVAKNTSTGFVRASLDREFGDVTVTFTKDVMDALRSGMICLRCFEPQSSAFADEHIEGCEGFEIHGAHYMRDRQILDIAMEFEGDQHLGPSKPMGELLDEQEERSEKRKFMKRVLDGGQGQIPKEWLRDATLLEGLDDEDRDALIRSVR